MAVINVKSAPYNAVGDGVADDKTAIQNALNAVAADPRGGEVYFPSGRYRSSSFLEITVGKSITLRGDREDVAELYFSSSTAAGKGVIYSVGAGDTSYGGLTVRDLTFVTRSNGGTAIIVNGNSDPNSIQRKPTIIDNVRILPESVSGQSGYFSLGVRLANSGLSIIRNLYYEGSRFSAALNDNWYDGIGIQLEAQGEFGAGFSIIDPAISNCTTGIDITGLLEGGTIRGGSVTNVRTGVKCEYKLGNQEPGPLIVDLYVAATEKSISLNRAPGTVIKGCAIGKVADTAAGFPAALKSRDWAGIYCDNFSDMIVADNVIAAPLDSAAQTGKQRGIVMVTGAFAAISGNVIDGGASPNQTMDTGIWLQAGCSNSKATYNTFKNVVAGRDVLNQGGGNSVF